MTSHEAQTENHSASNPDWMSELIPLTLERAALYFLFACMVIGLDGLNVGLKIALGTISLIFCLIMAAATRPSPLAGWLTARLSHLSRARGWIAYAIAEFTLVAYFVFLGYEYISAVSDAPRALRGAVAVGGFVLILLFLASELHAVYKALPGVRHWVETSSVLNEVRRAIASAVALTSKLGGRVIVPFLIGMLLCVSLACLLPWIRLRVYEYSQVGGKKWADALWSRLGLVLMGSYTIVLLLPFIVARYAFGWTDQTVEAMALGALLVVFISIESPHLLRPNLLVVMMPSKDRGYDDKPSLAVRLRTGHDELLFFRLTNVGTAFSSNCQCWFSFPEGFMPMEYSDDLYRGIDFVRQYEVQKQNRCAKFTPDRSYLGIAPMNHMVFPLWVSVTAKPNPNKPYKVRVGVQSESNWGEFTRELQIEVA